MSAQFSKGALVRVVKLCKDKEQLGYMWFDEDKWIARREGAMGLVVGMNPMTNDVYFVMHREEDERTVAAYGADEIELVEGNEAKVAFLRHWKRRASCG